MNGKNMQVKQRFNLPPVMVCIIAILFMSLVMYLMYHFNNKYYPCDTHSDSLVFLTDNWDYFPGHLYTPKNIPAEGKKITVGEVANHQNALGTPYGTATYRLKVPYKGNLPALTIQIPEIPSACAIYINGIYYGGNGDVRPDYYKPLIRDLTFSFPALSENEILIQTANYSHYYSGLYYPPMLGSADSVEYVSLLRIFSYALLAVSALTLGIFSLSSWTDPYSGRRGTLFALGFLDFSFVLYISYPFLRMTGAPSVSLLYALEDVGGFIVLLCTGIVTASLCGLGHSFTYRRFFLPCAVGLCLFSLFIPLFVLPAFPALTAVYGVFVSFSKLLFSLLLTAWACYGAFHRISNSLSILFGVTVFGTGLFFEVLSVGAYEPVIAGWPQEIGTYAMVLTFAGAAAAKNHRIMQENRYLNQHLSEEVEKKTSSLNFLLDERRKFLSAIIHDLKTPLTAIRNYLQLIDRRDIAVTDSETASPYMVTEYLEAAAGKTRELELRLNTLQDFSSEEIPKANCIPFDFCAFLKEFHKINKPDIELEGQHFTLSIPDESCIISGDRELLTRAFENLCYNALSFNPPEGTIALELTVTAYAAILKVRDNGAGISAEDLPHIFEYGYSKRTGQSGNGLGLFITKTIILEHQGYITAASTPGKFTEFTIELPLYPL